MSALKIQIFVVILLCGFGELLNGLPIGIPPDAVPLKLNRTVMQRFSWDRNPSSNSTNGQCRLRPVDKSIHGTVKNNLEFSKLLEYTFTVAGYKVNPLAVNNTWNYKPEHWARVASSHGQTILNLAFNYGILSLMTLSFGISKLNVELEDVPTGCLASLNEDEKVLAVLDIVLRDLKADGRIKVYEGQSSVCHQYIKEVSGMAKFTDRCCYESIDSETIECIIDIPNKWLSVLDILLGTLTVVMFIFGPMMIPDWFYTAAMDNLDYYVKLKEPLYKKMAICRRDIAQDIDAVHVLNLRNRRDFQKCRRIISEIPDDMIIPIKISQFDIHVNYRKLLVENKVPVGMIESISRAIFLCKIKELDAFKDCCDANIAGCLTTPENERPYRPWISLCNLFGRFLLVFFVPFPFYIRLAVYYVFENPEIVDRHEAAENLDLIDYYNFRLIQFLTPTHPVYLTIYIIYFLSGFTIAYLSGTEKKTRFQQAVMDAFQDMKGLSMLKAFEMLISNCLWPFKRFGVFGCFIGVVLWPLLLPISTIACCIYCLPMIFLSFRIVLHTFTDTDERKEKIKPSPQKFQADQVIETLNSRSTRRAAIDTFSYCNPNIRRFLLNLFFSTMAITTLYSAMLIVAEITTFIAEIICFTMMGIIVNASTVLKYGTLLLLVVLYSYDCYSNVNKKYLKLNKAIFSEIKHRLGKDIDQYTQLPSHIQENRGFKSAEASEQAEYESTDDISPTLPYHWDINDLILFIDQEDTPRIPKKLFEDVCQINVAGAPGPVYRSLIDATRKFLIIICFLGFVFIVVLSFGESYKMSSANQMLATMAGGFAPLMFRYVFKPGKADVETGLLSFRSKLEEIIKNFCQTWPVYEFMFDIEEEPKPEEEDEGKDEGKDDAVGEDNDECECQCIGAKENEKDKNSNDKILINEKDDEFPVCCSKHANIFERRESGINSNQSSMKSKNGKGGNDKDKDKKDKDGKDKKGKDIDWLSNITRTKDFVVNDIKEKLENMVLEPAEGTKVDILVYVSDSDREWNYEESVIDFDIDESKDEGSDKVLIKQNGFGPKMNYISLNNLQNV